MTGPRIIRVGDPPPVRTVPIAPAGTPPHPIPSPALPRLDDLIDVDAAGAPAGVPLTLELDATTGRFRLVPTDDAARPLAFKHAWSQSLELVQIPHGLPFEPAGVTIRDSSGALIDPGDVTHPLPGFTELHFGVPIGPAVAWLS